MNLQAGSVELSAVGCVTADGRGMHGADGQVCGLQGIGNKACELFEIKSAGKCA